jgi:glycosyltransferase involved in cell wall biosynthesis
MLLSAALIVRDEAEHLDACLTSLRGLVDEIVVVDTGSSDNSPEIARRHGAVVATEPWRADFSAVRNRSLDLVTGDWVLYIDADERVEAVDPDAARAALATADACVAYRVRFVPRVGWTPYREFRLWRSRPDIRFRNAIHESIVPAIDVVARREQLRVEPLDLFTIHHLGYEGDQRAKHARDEPMLVAEIALKPDRSFLYDHLARVYEAVGDSSRAVETWWRGIEVARARGSTHPDDRLVYLGLLFHLLARGEVTDDVGALVAEALAVLPRLPSLELAAARYEFATGDPAAAIPRLEWLVALDLDEVIETESSYDGRVLGEWAWDLLGLCRFALGDDAGAADAFGRAARLAPHDPLYEVRRQLAEARAARR